MKIIHRTILLSLVPLLTPLTAIAESRNQSELIYPVNLTKDSSASWRASQVIGVNVKNAEGQTIGEIEDIVLDMKSGEVLAVIVTSGGFLGIADTLSAVPVAVLRYDEQAKAYKTKLTKEQLGKAPQFKSDAWPDYSDETSIEALRTYRNSIDDGGDTADRTTQNEYHTSPSRNSTSRNNNQSSRNENTSSRDNENTAQNEDALDKQFVSPTDQGNSKQDIQMTKNIRSSIMDTDMSHNAKNIKIITRNERVTLNGVVDSEKEHKEILKIAGNHCQESRINDNLTVKNK